MIKFSNDPNSEEQWENPVSVELMRPFDHGFVSSREPVRPSLMWLMVPVGLILTGSLIVVLVEFFHGACVMGPNTVCDIINR